MTIFQHAFGVRAAALVFTLSGVACGPHHTGGSGGSGPSDEAGAPSSGGSSDSAGSGDVAGSGGASAGGAAGSFSAGPPDYGYDQTVGCEAQQWPGAATFKILSDPSLGFEIWSLSADGRVIGGRYNSSVSLRYFV